MFEDDSDEHNDRLAPGEVEDPDYFPQDDFYEDDDDFFEDDDKSNDDDRYNR